jgi:hypothetical protein
MRMYLDRLEGKGKRRMQIGGSGSRVFVRVPSERVESFAAS